MKYGILTLSLPISSELDRSKDHQFRGYQDFDIGNGTIKFESEEALDQEDHYLTSSGSDP